MSGDDVTDEAEHRAVTDLYEAHARLVETMDALGSICASRTEPLAVAELATFDQLGAALSHAVQLVDEARA